MKVNVTTMRVQCSTCGEPVNAVESLAVDESAAVRTVQVLLEPCGHTMNLAT